MPDARVQLAVEVEVEGAEELTSLRRQLEQLGEAGAEAIGQLDASLTAVLDQLEQSRALVGAATQSFLQSHRQLLTGLEPAFAAFFQRLLAGARNFHDLLKRLLTDLLQFFLRTVAQMVSGWLAGLRQMSGFSLGGFFGGGGSLLSAGLGALAPPSGGLAGPGGTPPFFPGGGGASATNIGLLEKLGINLHDLGPIPGNLLFSGGLLGLILGFTRGSRVLGTLGGAGLGFSIGGPIGGIIGGLLGFLTGLFGRGRLKRKATDIAVQGFAALRDVAQQFKDFKLDFESTLAEMQAIWAQMVQSWSQMGGIGQRSIRSQQPFFDQLVRRVKEIQAERERRAALIGALPIPEFAQGGLVGQTFLSAFQAIHSGQGKLLAFLHPGEAVLNARAVSRLGPAFVEQVNRAPSLQSGGMVGGSLQAERSRGTFNVTVNVFPAPGMDERALAGFTLRELERRLRDRGLSLG